jgi:hypothetical protein
MCHDYHLVNKWTRLNKYAITLSEEIFDTKRQVKKICTLDLQFSYHLLLLKEDDKVKITFWEIDPHGKVICMNWSFCDLVWIRPLQIFKRSMLRLKQFHKFPNQWLSHRLWAFLNLCKENIKQAKGNECNRYKSIAAIFSSSLPICPIHIFSSDTQACFALVTPYNMPCFALVTSHNMPSNMLHTPLYP